MVGCASPAGDEFAIMEQVHAITNVPIPKNLASLKERPVRHKDVIDRDAMLEYIVQKALLKEW